MVFLGENKSLGGRARAVRTESGLQMGVAARAIDVSISTLSMIESGKRNPSPRTLRAIARLYNVDPEWLKTGKGNRGEWSEDHPGNALLANVLPEVRVLIMRMPEDKQRSLLIPYLEALSRPKMAKAA